MATWESALAGNSKSTNVRKYVFGSTLVRDYGVDLSTYLTGSPFGSGGDIALTASSSVAGASGAVFLDLGYTSGDGATFANSMDGSDTTAWQTRDVIRHDITSDISTVQFSCLETKLGVLALFNNLPVSGGITAPTSASGFSVAKPPAQTVYRSLWVIGVDGTGLQANYAAVLLPRCAVSDRDDQTWNSDSEVSYNLTVTAFPDPNFGGLSKKTWYGGPGMSVANVS